MPIKSSLKNFEPARQVFKREITLLSRGYYDRAAFPDGKITVFPWDVDIDAWVQQVQHEAKYKTRLLWELTAKLCNLNGCKIEKLPVGDVYTILFVARAITSDSVIEYTPTCTKCGQVNQRVTVRVPDELERVGEKPLDYPGWDEFKLPKSGDVVRLRPYTVEDELVVTGRDEQSRKKVPDRMLRLCAPVVSIGGGAPDSLDELVGWWSALHPKDRQEFITQQDLLYPHLNPELEHVCDVCGAKFVHTLNVNAEFFR